MLPEARGYTAVVSRKYDCFMYEGAMRVDVVWRHEA